MEDMVEPHGKVQAIGSSFKSTPAYNQGSLEFPLTLLCFVRPASQDDVCRLEKSRKEKTKMWGCCMCPGNNRMAWKANSRDGGYNGVIE